MLPCSLAWLIIKQPTFGGDMEPCDFSYADHGSISLSVPGNKMTISSKAEDAINL